MTKKGIHIVDFARPIYESWDQQKIAPPKGHKSWTAYLEELAKDGDKAGTQGEPTMDREEISQILINALGGEEAKITINHPENAGETTTTGTAREVAEHLADLLLNAGLH